MKYGYTRIPNSEPDISPMLHLYNCFGTLCDRRHRIRQINYIPLSPYQNHHHHYHISLSSQLSSSFQQILHSRFFSNRHRHQYRRCLWLSKWHIDLIIVYLKRKIVSYDIEKSIGFLAGVNRCHLEIHREGNTLVIFTVFCLTDTVLYIRYCMYIICFPGTCPHIVG